MFEMEKNDGGTHPCNSSKETTLTTLNVESLHRQSDV